MKKRPVSLIAVILSVLLLSGCKNNKSIKNMPDDRPWNSGDGTPIMETEDGYYINHKNMLFLRYHDKQTDKEIFLCNKPECMHDGSEECTATYKNLSCGISTVLYNNEIYFIGTDENDGKKEIGLYKVSADGSSLDRIEKFFDIKSMPDQTIYTNMSTFIIHRGYAYINYYLSTPEGGYVGFIGSGFLRMNIKTGEIEKISSNEDYFSSKTITNIHGCGDYVYYNLYNNSTADNGAYRYNVNTGEISLLKNDKGEKIFFNAVTESKIYAVEKDPETKKSMLFTYDSNTLQKLDEKIKNYYLQSDNLIIPPEILAYDGKIFIAGTETIVYQDGKIIGSISLSDLMQNGDQYCYCINNFKISYGKLYCNVNFYRDYSNDPFIGSGFVNDDIVDVYCCSIDDIIAGTAKWEKAYSRNEEDQKWSDQFCNSRFGDPFAD